MWCSEVEKTIIEHHVNVPLRIYKTDGRMAVLLPNF